MPGPLKNKGEGIVELRLRAQPDELAGAGVDLGLEGIGVACPGPGVHPVGRHHQIVLPPQRVDVGDLGLELQVDAEGPGAVLQQHQHRLAAQPAEAVARRGDRGAVLDDPDVVPIGEVVADEGGAFGVVHLQVVERFVGEHDAPAEGVVSAVAFDDGDRPVGSAKFQADGEVEAGGAAAKADSLHRAFLVHWTSVKCLTPEKSFQA